MWQAHEDSSRKVEIFLGGTAGPDNPQFAQYNLFGNAQAFGLIESRPNDQMGVSVWYNWLSDNFVDLVSPVVELRDMYGVEFYYNFQVAGWAHLTGNLQLIENEFKGDDLAVVPGVRLVIDF